MELGGASFILMAVELAVRTLFTEDCFRHMQFYLQRQRLKGGEAKNGWPLAPLACGPTILKRLCFAPLLIGVFEFYTLLQVDKINVLEAGKVPESVTPHLCGTSLLPCKKKNGGL